MILAYIFWEGRGKSQAEPVTGKSISCKESLCPSHCKSYKIETGMGFDMVVDSIYKYNVHKTVSKNIRCETMQLEKSNPEAPIQKM